MKRADAMKDAAAGARWQPGSPFFSREHGGVPLDRRAQTCHCGLDPQSISRRERFRRPAWIPGQARDDKCLDQARVQEPLSLRARPAIHSRQERFSGHHGSRIKSGMMRGAAHAKSIAFWNNPNSFIFPIE
jgi:hypothetical protein